jgi:hypothetical protein
LISDLDEKRKTYIYFYSPYIMSLNDGSESPPLYDDVVNEICQPTILVLAAQSIHPESADSAPLYQLSLAVESLTPVTSQVEFRRVERSVKTRTGEPTVKAWTRHIYNLRYGRKSSYCYIQAVSRRTVGSVGLKKSLLRSHWTALPMEVSSKNSGCGFVKDAQPLFNTTFKGGRYEWTDGDGNAVAVEDDGEDQHRILVTASLRQDSMDALVALWCYRIGAYSAKHTEHVARGFGRVRLLSYIYPCSLVADKPIVPRRFRVGRINPLGSNLAASKLEGIFINERHAIRQEGW